MTEHRAQRFLGLISGTSADGVDAALLRIAPATLSNPAQADPTGTALASAPTPVMQVEASLTRPYPAALRSAVLQLCQPGDNELDRLGELDRALGEVFAQTALGLLAQQGLEPADVCAIGSHGQTVRHRPARGETGRFGFSLQIGDPHTIAERTGITTVADFRRRDVAAGGEGAPLVPAFHQACFAVPGERRAVLNLGGIANLTLLDGEQLLGGFDTGPANALLDHWAERHLGTPCDYGGAWAAQGQIIPTLLEQMLGDPYFQRRGPRSTGREDFNPQWLGQWQQLLEAHAAADVQATLAEFSAKCIALALAAEAFDPHTLLVCGGGVHNTDLLHRLRANLTGNTRVCSCAEEGMDPDAVEAAAFAWLAYRCLRGQSGNAPQATGAVGARILGAICPAA